MCGHSTAGMRDVTENGNTGAMGKNIFAGYTAGTVRLFACLDSGLWDVKLYYTIPLDSGLKFNVVTG